MKFVVFGLFLLSLYSTTVLGTAKTTITVWHSFDRQQTQFLKTQIVQPYAKSKGINVRLESGLDIRSSLLMGAETGVLPEIVFAPFDMVALAQHIPFAQVTKRPTNLSTSDLETVTWQNKLYGIPVLSGNHLVMYFNRQIVTAPAKNWPELLKQKEKLPKGVRIVALDYGAPYTFLSFFHAFGDRPIDNKGNPNLNNESCVNALTLYRDLANQQLLNERCDYRCATKEFFTGKYAYSIHGDWAFTEANRSLGKNLGITNLPKIKNHSMRSLRGSHALFYPKITYKKKKEQIDAFSQHLISDKVQSLWSNKGGRLPTNQKIMQSIQTTPDHPLNPFAKQLAQAVPLVNSPAVAYMWPALKKGMDLYLSKVMNAKEACAQMQNLATRKPK